MKSGPHLPQLEKALTQKRRPNTAKNKLINKNKIKKKKKSSKGHLAYLGSTSFFPTQPRIQPT